MPADSLFDQALKAEGVSGKLADLARSIYSQESGAGKNTKTSNRGAVGGMQILPSTFRSVADDGWKIDDPMDNARGGIRYLKQLASKAGGDPTLTAAGYYGGPGAIDKARQGVAVSDPRNPNAPNTLQYGAQVAARAGLGSGLVSVAANDNAVSPQAPTPGPAAPAVVVAPQSQDVAPPMTVAVAEPAIAPVVTSTPNEAGPDPWQEFLRNVTPARGPSNEAFASPGTLSPYTYEHGPFQAAVVAPRAVQPNFEAFAGWKRAA